MTLSAELDKQIQRGRQGDASIIPIAYERVSEYIDISKNTMYVIGGETSVGKSTIAIDMFIINPIKWYMQHRNPSIKLSVIYLGMERKMYMTTARIISRLIFEDTGRHIPPYKILGRKAEHQMSESEYALVQEYYKILDEWEKDDLFIAHENSKNPSGISMYLEQFAMKHGVIHKKDKEDHSMENTLTAETYTPTHQNHIILVVVDHIGILAPEKVSGTTKQNIDKFSACMRKCRDVYGFSPVIVQQLNRNLSDVQRQKLGDLSPKLSDFADSSQTQQDADVIMALFDPYRHVNAADPGKDDGYDLKRLRDDKFRTYYRSLHILKNSFSSSGMKLQMSVQPVYGILRTLPRNNAIPETIYDDILSGVWFMPEVTQQQIPLKAFSGFGHDRTRMIEEVKTTTV